jgi:hypothetical protein
MGTPTWYASKGSRTRKHRNEERELTQEAQIQVG